MFPENRLSVNYFILRCNGVYYICRRRGELSCRGDEYIPADTRVVLTTEVMQIAYIIFSPSCGFISSYISPSGLGGLPCTNHCGVI